MVARGTTKEDLLPGAQVRQGCHCAGCASNLQNISSISALSKDFLRSRQKNPALLEEAEKRLVGPANPLGTMKATGLHTVVAAHETILGTETK